MQQLTAEQQARLDSLSDNASTTKFSWDDTFQRKLLGMLLTDRMMLVQSLDKIQPGYFSNEVHVSVCKILFEYFQKHRAIPEKWVMQQELLDRIKDRDKAIQIYFQGELESLYSYFIPGMDTREYLLDKVVSFAKVQAVKIAFHKCVEKMTEAPEDDKTWSYVYEQMRQAMIVERTQAKGLEYFMNIDEMFRRMKEKMSGKDRFTTAFESIDNALTGGGLFPGEIGAWIALAGSGKSLCLTKAAVANVLLGHKVLYLTMEMDEVGVAQRFTSQLFKKDVNNLLGVEPEIRTSIDEFKRDKEDPNQLLITQFPGGQLDVNGVMGYCNQLSLKGWKPNLMILDYVGEMKNDPNIQKWESAYRILRDLRSFGIDEQHGTMTAIQPNAGATKLGIGEYIDEQHIGTAFDQIKPLDALWSINQQVIEKEAGVGRGFIIKHRNGRSKFPFFMGFDYALGTLDVFEVSRDKYREAMNGVQERRSGDVEFDQVGKRQRSKGGFKPNAAIEPTEEEKRGE